MCLIKNLLIFQIWRCLWQSWLVATRVSGWGWWASLFSYLYILYLWGWWRSQELWFPKSTDVWFKFQNPFLLLPGERTVQTIQGGRLPYCQRWSSRQGRKKYHILKNNLWLFKFWTLFLTGSSGEPWSRGALSKIPPLWPWRPCHCWGLEGHHQGEVRSDFFQRLCDVQQNMKHSL